MTGLAQESLDHQLEVLRWVQTDVGPLVVNDTIFVVDR